MKTCENVLPGSKFPEWKKGNLVITHMEEYLCQIAEKKTAGTKQVLFDNAESRGWSSQVT